MSSNRQTSAALQRVAGHRLRAEAPSEGIAMTRPIETGSAVEPPAHADRDAAAAPAPRQQIPHEPAALDPSDPNPPAPPTPRPPSQTDSGFGSFG
jgi:hypothetical protein